MKLSLRALLAAICLFLLSGTSQAQTPAEGTIDLFGTLGYARFGDADAAWASGLEYGAGAEFLPFTGTLRSLGITGGLIVVSSDDTTTSGLSTSVDARELTAAVSWHFSRGPVQPYVLGGIAIVSATRTSWCDRCNYTDPNTGAMIVQELRERIDATKGGVLAGGGIRFVPGTRASFRVETTVADTAIGDGWNWTWFGVRGAVGIRF